MTRPLSTEELTGLVARMLEDAVEIEGQPIAVDLITERKIRLRQGGRRFELTMVKKQRGG